MVTFHDVLVHEFRVSNTYQAPWLPETSASEEELENAFRVKFGNDRFSRKVLRLLADSVVEAMLADPHQQPEYVRELKKVRPVGNARTASFASSRLLKLAGWDRQDHGEGAGDAFASASRLAEIVGEHYSDWPTETYMDVAGLYEHAVNGAFDDGVRKVVLKLLADIREVEARKAKAEN